MDPSNQSDSSPYINDVDVVPPSPPAGQRDLEFNHSPYIQDYNQDFALGNSLGSPSFHDGSYYSPYSNHSELSFGGEHDINLSVFDNDSNLGLGLRPEYDPADFDAPQSSALLIYQDNEFMPQYNMLSASKSDPRNNNAPYDYSSPSSNASGNDDHPTDRRSRASSVSSNHANTFNASPRLDVAHSFEAMTFHSPGLTTERLPSVSHSPAPPPQPMSPPRLVMPDEQLGDHQGPPKINAPEGDSGMGGPSFNIVPATPIGGGSSAANPTTFQSTLETLPQGSTLGLQSQPWSSVDQRSTIANNQPSNPVPKQEFTFPSHGSLLGASAASTSHAGQTVDDSAIGGSNFLFVSQRSRSKSDNSPEQPTWDQPYLEQQRRLGTMGGSAVVDDQTVNMNDVLPGTQQSQLNPGFTFGAKAPNSFLSPDLNSIRRVKSESGPRPMHRQSRSEDIRGTGLAPPQPGHQHSQSSSGQFLFPPPSGQVGFLSPNQQPFYGGSTGSPDGPLPSISAGRSGSPVRTLASSPGHIRRASSGTRSERGAETWSGPAPLPQHRISPYPSPNASPRPRINDLPYDEYSGPNVGAGAGLLGVDGFSFPQQQQGFNSGYMSGTYSPSSTGASAYHTPGQSPSPAPPLTIDSAVPKPTVTTGRTANASHKRRKQDASFICPIPGCGSTFTRSFNLKGHIRSHKEEKPFVCHWPGCGKGFARQHDCKRHEQLHSNYRPYQCDGCGKQFARMDALNRHLRSEGGADCQKLLKANGKIDPDSDTVKTEKMEGVAGVAL
ncbi:hypothetical protein D9756_003539 [Leucocoprinus leucothites]|uniref:C2H2-type domain-containing protein n=1 Tax=Leucocoprinus leucothites TaxID=201217 RepID=A0A8H5G690_9AGAR|nr:hypothetical protein D9756_003539 [Leucoagaricus leucothites]